MARMMIDSREKLIGALIGAMFALDLPVLFVEDMADKVEKLTHITRDDDALDIVCEEAIDAMRTAKKDKILTALAYLEKEIAGEG